MPEGLERSTSPSEADPSAEASAAEASAAEAPASQGFATAAAQDEGPDAAESQAPSKPAAPVPAPAPPSWAPTPAVFESEMAAVRSRGGKGWGGSVMVGWMTVLLAGGGYLAYRVFVQDSGAATALATAPIGAGGDGTTEPLDVEVNALLKPELKTTPKTVKVDRDPFGRGRGGSRPVSQGQNDFAPAVFVTEQHLEYELKGLSNFAAEAGLQTVRARALNPQRSASLFQQPVDFGAHGEFHSVLSWVTALHQSRPGWVVGWLQLTPMPGAAGRPSTRVNASVSLWAYAAGSQAGASPAAGAPMYPRLDLGTTLRQIAAAAGKEPVTFRELHLGPDTAPGRTASDAPRLKGWVVGTAASPHDVNDLVVRLARSDVLLDVTLVESIADRSGRGSGHKFKVEFRANPFAAPRQPALAVPDPFRLTTGNGAAKQAAPRDGGEADPFVDSDAAAVAAEAAERLTLRAVVGKACMINNRSYRVGDVVEGFTIVQITDHGVVVSSGATRVELKLGKR